MIIIICDTRNTILQYFELCSIKKNIILYFMKHIPT